jgi:hypothetical protein
MAPVSSKMWWSLAVVLSMSACGETTLAPEDAGSAAKGTGSEEEPTLPEGSSDGDVVLQPLPGAAGTVTGIDVVALAINRFGHVVGASGGRAVLWEDGVPTALPVPVGSSASVARSINDAGQIVGTVELDEPAGSSRAVLWEGETVTDLGSLPDALETEANHINADGLIVGRSGGSAVMWADGEVRALDTPEGFPRDPFASFSNTSGLIIGESHPEEDPSGSFVAWNDDGTIQSLFGRPDEEGGRVSDLTGITEDGAVFTKNVESSESHRWLDGEGAALMWLNPDADPPLTFVHVGSVSPGGLLVGGRFTDYPVAIEWGFWKRRNFVPVGPGVLEDRGEFIAFEDQENYCFLISDGGYVVCRSPSRRDGEFVRKLRLAPSGCGCPASSSPARDEP